MKKKVSILGSTGSIGVSALDVIENHPDRFEVIALAAGTNVLLLAEQIKRFSPKFVSVKNEEFAEELKGICCENVEIVHGVEGAVQVATAESADMVLSAMVGSAGLKPTYEAIKAGKDIALANKETLVAAGELVMKAVNESGVKLLPVDSEHSAIFQSMEGHRKEDINKIILTASGGPFRNYSGDLSKVSVEDALNHPNWSMGAKITIDSATLMNKGFEVIEAYWLFGMSLDKIEVVIHPQSIIHSMVEYKDGSIIAQLGNPDMRGPISYALAYPERIESNVKNVDWKEMATLTFKAPDYNRFPMLKLAKEALKKKGASCAVLNASNEIAVQAFLDRKIKFTDIYNIVSEVVEEYIPEKADSIDAILEIDSEARKITQKKIR